MRLLYIECDSGKNSGSHFIDVETREAPVIANGNTITFRFGCFNFDRIRNLSAFNTINFQIRESQSDDDPAFYDQDIAPGDITASITKSSWLNKTGYHIDHDVLGTSLDYNLGSNSSAKLWAVLTGLDASGNETTLGAGDFYIAADNNYNPDGSVYVLASQNYEIVPIRVVDGNITFPSSVNATYWPVGLNIQKVIFVFDTIPDTVTAQLQVGGVDFFSTNLVTSANVTQKTDIDTATFPNGLISSGDLVEVDFDSIASGVAADCTLFFVGVLP